MDNKFDVIVEKLQEIEKQHQIKLLYVAESGSRDWGVSSIDSDYDVRGIFLSTTDEYLSIDEPKETIEWIENQWFDVGAWDLRKTLRLLRKSNSVIFEWLQSPIVYQQLGRIKEDLLALAAVYFQPFYTVYHYRGIAKKASASTEGENIRLKKWFYLLRALLAAYWVVQKGTIPPMQLADLLVLLEMKERKEIEALVLFKKDKDEQFVWSASKRLQNVITFLWEKTDVAIAMREVPNTNYLNQWFRRQVDAFNN